MVDPRFKFTTYIYISVSVLQPRLKYAESVFNKDPDMWTDTASVGERSEHDGNRISNTSNTRRPTKHTTYVICVVKFMFMLILLEKTDVIHAIQFILTCCLTQDL